MTTLSKTVRKTNAYGITVWNLKKILTGKERAVATGEGEGDEG